MANPSGTHLQHQDATNANSNAPSSALDEANPANGNPVNPTTASKLKHNPGVSNDWAPDEQSILEDGLAKYSSSSNIIRYAKIAVELKAKTVRDVALRCRWMTRKESGKRRKDDNLARKGKDKKEKLTDAPTKPSSSRANAPAYTNTVVPIDSDDGISFKTIGGVTGELLEQNALALSQITSNLSTMQIQENVNLLCRTRDNILQIMNNLNDAPEVMKQMPPLPVKMNEELANTILPRPNIP
ncbi:unnamed protein product [Linum tenue]|uniref:Myb-like domain-containing protein n=1 Tax=Linum tenue TaxID=586396 RepID=A0AAV0IJS5_9ROSI|nr:unnamed protein product [Linum tenue]